MTNLEKYLPGPYNFLDCKKLEKIYIRRAVNARKMDYPRALGNFSYLAKSWEYQHEWSQIAHVFEAYGTHNTYRQIFTIDSCIFRFPSCL